MERILVPSFIMLLALGVGLALVLGMSRLRRKNGSSSALTEIKGFTPGELDRLKDQGLLTEDEAKRIQSIVAERAVEEMQKQEAPEQPPPDLNTLLSEAEQARRKHSKETPSKEAGEET